MAVCSGVSLRSWAFSGLPEASKTVTKGSLNSGWVFKSSMIRPWKSRGPEVAPVENPGSSIVAVFNRAMSKLDPAGLSCTWKLPFWEERTLSPKDSTIRAAPRGTGLAAGSSAGRVEMGVVGLFEGWRGVMGGVVVEDLHEVSKRAIAKKAKILRVIRMLFASSW
jgi:hypothetical protein